MALRTGTALSRRLRSLLDRRSTGSDPHQDADRLPALRAPIFVGGTGRSGTTVTGRILGAHHDCHMLPFEVRFISDRGGLCDLVEGETRHRAFERLALDRWYDRGPTNGLHLLVAESDLRAALRDLRAGSRRDPARAAAEFVGTLFDPPTRAAGAHRWVEMTPSNVRVTPRLLRVWPDARVVHVMRDGRDAAVSVAGLEWGPDDPLAALDWWADRLGRGLQAAAACPEDRVLLLSLEALVLHDRVGQYDRLLRFAGLDDAPGAREFFETRVTAERAHLGRWRKDIPQARLAEFEARHAELQARLDASWGDRLRVAAARPDR